MRAPTEPLNTGGVEKLGQCLLSQEVLSWFLIGSSLSRRCRSAGKPHLGPADRVRLIQHWKQLVGQLKKKQNACKGEKVLRAPTKKVTTEAQMKLMHSSEEEVRKSKKSRAQSGGEVTATKEKVEVMAMSTSEGGVRTDPEPGQTFCSQGWSSVCSFFLTLLQAPGSI